MDRTDVLHAAREMLADNGRGLADLLCSLPDVSTRLGGGSVWTVQQVAAHVATGSDIYTDIATGVPSPLGSLTSEVIAEFTDSRIAEVCEADPVKLAAMVSGGVERFLETTSGWSADQDIPWHAGLHLDLTDLTAIWAADVALHGYDVACAVGAPWPIPAQHALVAIGAYAPLLHLVQNHSVTAGHTAAYGITIVGGPSIVVRFTDGVLALEPGGAPTDCVITADPVAFLLVFTGRLSPWPAISLGLISAAGPRPELAMGFLDFFGFF